MTPEEIEQRVARALELHTEGYNCAQAVSASLSDYVSVPEEDLFRLAEGFGGGMGGFSETCGALSGGVLVLGCSNSDGPQNPKTKGSTYKLTRQLVESFKAQNGSSLCSELKGLSHGPALRSCPDCIADGVRMTIAILDEAGKKPL